MRDFKELILNYIMDKNNKATTLEMLADIFSVDSLEFKDFVKAFNELDEQGLVLLSKKNTISYAPYQHIYKATIKLFRKYDVVCETINNDEILIDYDELNGAYLNDEVQIYYNYKDYFGKVLKVLKRADNKIVATYKKNSFLIENKNFPYEIFVKKETDKYHLVNGHIVLLDIIDYQNNELICKINSIIGHENDPGIDVLTEIIKANVPYKFSASLIKKTNEIISQKEKKQADEMKNRKDLTDKLIVTIDGLDAKDLDDAISLEISSNGNYLLGVHIADVSYYVEQNSILDKNALERSNSIYLCDRVIPMLPHELSNGICSLNANEIRLTMSCQMEIDYQGNVINYEIFPSYIKSSARLDYDDVNDLFDNKPTRLTYSKQLKQMLFMMERLSTILEKKMVQDGYIELNVTESKFVVDYEKHEVIDILKRSQRKAEKLIENFMILANQTVASHIYYMQLPFIYRVHDKIQETKKEMLLANLFPLHFKTKLNVLSYQNIQGLLNEVKGTNYEYFVNDILLRSMSKAIYSTENIGHFGLGLDCYCHFTSPIRRYPDLIVHRFLKKYLFENDFTDELVYLSQVAKICSTNERKAMALERKVEDIYKAKYMAKFIGYEYEGVVSGVMNFGVFVMLDNTCEGLVRNESLPYFQYVNKDKLTIGSKVTVRVASVNEKLGEINLVMVSKKTYNK